MRENFLKNKNLANNINKHFIQETLSMPNNKHKNV